MRVLVISDQAHDPGRRQRLRALAGLDVEVILATPGGAAGTDGGVRLAPIPTRGSADAPEGLRWDPGTLRRLLVDTRPQVIHLEAEPDSHLAATVARLAGKLGLPYLVFSWRSLPRTGGFFARRRATRVLRGAVGVIGGNRLAMELLHESAPQAIATAIPPHGVEIPPPIGRSPGPTLVIGFAGRLVPERGADFLVAALGRTYGQWRAVFVGTGPDQESIEVQIQRHGLAARIRWLGGLREESLAALFDEIDCLVVPSRDTPTWVDHHAPILLEAMGRGIAPVVTRAGALPELVGESGRVVATEAELAETLQPWVSEPARCRAIGELARQRILERYTVPAVAARTLEFWRAAVEHASPDSSAPAEPMAAAR